MAAGFFRHPSAIASGSKELARHARSSLAKFLRLILPNQSDKYKTQMKFNAPTLTAGKRATFKRTKEWLIDLRSELEKKRAHLDKLNLALEEAESRKARFGQDAALNPDAAIGLAGAEAQLSRLANEINQLQQTLERESATAIRQVNLVRSSEVRELLLGPFQEQIIDSIAAAIGPFYDAGWARQYAKGMFERSNQYRQVSFYLNRPPAIITAEFEDAKREIDALVDQLEQILAGEPPLIDA